MSGDATMTTHGIRALTAERAVKYHTLATLLMTVCAQLLLAACAEEVNKLAPPPPTEHGFGPYLETAPYLSSGLADDHQILPSVTSRSASYPDEPRNTLSPPPAAAEEGFAIPSFQPRGP